MWYSWRCDVSWCLAEGGSTAACLQRGWTEETGARASENSRGAGETSKKEGSSFLSVYI